MNKNEAFEKKFQERCIREKTEKEYKKAVFNSNVKPYLVDENGKKIASREKKNSVDFKKILSGVLFGIVVIIVIMLIMIGVSV